MGWPQTGGLAQDSTMKPSHSMLRGCLASAAILLAGCGDDPRTILETMAQRYRSAERYADDARVTIRQTQGAEQIERAYPYRVAFVRPDRLRVEAYDARVVADGETLRAAVGGVPGQVLEEPIESPLTLDQLFDDDALRVTLTEGEAGCPAQLPLLLADDTLDLILADAEAPRIIGRETVDDHPCTRLAIAKQDGTLELWVDRETHLLRRMRVPTAAYADGLSQEAGSPVGLVVEVDFTAASIDDAVPDDAFAFEVPATATAVSRLVPLEPPHPPHPLLGKKVTLPTLTAADGTTVAAELLAGTTVVLEYFFADCGPSATVMPQVARSLSDVRSAHARAHEGERPAIVHLAVSLDDATVATDDVRKTLAEFGGVGTLVRDTDGATVQALSLEAFPATVILAPDGTVADVIIGFHDRIASDVGEDLAAVMAGRSTADLVRPRHEQRVREYRRSLEQASGAATPAAQTPIADRRQADRFKLERAWRAPGVAMPGPLVCLDQACGLPAPRLVALDGWQTIVELDGRGVSIARHELDVPTDGGITLLRTGTDATGHRFWLGVDRAAGAAFLFDDAWQRHPGTLAPTKGRRITTGDLADLDGDGGLDVVLGTDAGIEVMRLTGEPIWHDDSVGSVTECAVGPPGTDGRRDVIVATAAGSLARASRGPSAPTPADGRATGVMTVVTGPVGAGGTWAALALVAEQGHLSAKGVALDTLAATWSLPLGAGSLRDDLPPPAWADLLGPSRRQWLVAGPDGSVTLAWADGRIVDRYRHGRPIVAVGGFAAGDDRHIVIATADALEAYRLTDVALD